MILIELHQMICLNREAHSDHGTPQQTGPGLFLLLLNLAVRFTSPALHFFTRTIQRIAHEIRFSHSS